MDGFRNKSNQNRDAMWSYIIVTALIIFIMIVSFSVGAVFGYGRRQADDSDDNIAKMN